MKKLLILPVAALALAGCSGGGQPTSVVTTHHVVVHQVPAPHATVTHKHVVIHKHVVTKSKSRKK